MSPNNGCKGEYPVVESLEELIALLYEAFESDRVNTEYIKYIMKAYKSRPADWRKYAKFDQYRYTRNLVDAGNGKFNLMILCWGEGHGSAVHDHADAHCFMKILSGSLSEVRFEWPKGTGGDDGSDDAHDQQHGLEEISRTKLNLNEVCYINDSLGLHRVENPSHVEPAVSLHLYCPPFDSCSMFDQRTGHRTKCKVTFWSKYGERSPYGTESSCSMVEPENN